MDLWAMVVRGALPAWNNAFGKDMKGNYAVNERKRTISVIHKTGVE